jgi:hypothetical protein
MTVRSLLGHSAHRACPPAWESRARALLRTRAPASPCAGRSVRAISWKRRAGHLKLAGRSAGLAFSHLALMIPEPWGRRRAPSSGLIARDEVACVTQAPAKGLEGPHHMEDVGISQWKSNATFDSWEHPVTAGARGDGRRSRAAGSARSASRTPLHRTRGSRKDRARRPPRALG